MTIPASVYQADKLFEKQVANQAATAATQQSHAASQRQSAAAFALVKDDYADVIHKGENLLSKYQQMEVLDAGTDFGQVSYDMCKKAIEASKPAPKTSEPTDEEKAAAEAKAKEEAEKEAEANKSIPSQDDILSNVSLQTTRVMNI